MAHCVTSFYVTRKQTVVKLSEAALPTHWNWNSERSIDGKKTAKKTWLKHTLYVNKRARKNSANYTQNPTFYSLPLWLSARYEMHSLCSKPYTNHTLKRSKPYTKRGANPTRTRAQNLHEREHKTYTKRSTNPTQNEAKTLHCNGTQFYLGAHLGKTRSAPKKNQERT